MPTGFVAGLSESQEVFFRAVAILDFANRRLTMDVMTRILGARLRIFSLHRMPVESAKTIARDGIKGGRTSPHT